MSEQVMEKRLLELNALIDTHVFGTEVVWSWCMLKWNPSGEDWWESIEEYFDLVAKGGSLHDTVMIHPKNFDDWSLEIRVTKDWREHPEDYGLVWMPCAVQKDVEGKPFLFFPCPFYSTEIQRSWEVVERMVPEYTFSLWSTDEGLWKASFSPGEIATSFTAPEAICAAALLIKGPITIKLD